MAGRGVVSTKLLDALAADACVARREVSAGERPGTVIAVGNNAVLVLKGQRGGARDGVVALTMCPVWNPPLPTWAWLSPGRRG